MFIWDPVELKEVFEIVLLLSGLVFFYSIFRFYLRLRTSNKRVLMLWKLLSVLGFFIFLGTFFGIADHFVDDLLDDIFDFFNVLFYFSAMFLGVFIFKKFEREVKVK